MKPGFLLHALVFPTSILAACAVDPPATPKDSPSTATVASSEMICAKEYPTGSNIAVMKCRTREQVEAERLGAARGLSRAQTGGPNAQAGGAGN
jgi:hypothetical protein